jgi:DNA repair exonuclease SbcCD ATPase subunit
MGTSNAERQAAWRARRNAELKELRARVAQREKAQPKASALNAKEAEELQALRMLHTAWEPINTRLRAELQNAEQECKRLRAQVRGLAEKQRTKVGWCAPRTFTKAERYRQLIHLCHPDKHNGSKLSVEVSQWLNATRPGARRGTKLGK